MSLDHNSDPHLLGIRVDGESDEGREKEETKRKVRLTSRLARFASQSRYHVLSWSRLRQPTSPGQERPDITFIPANSIQRKTSTFSFPGHFTCID